MYKTFPHEQSTANTFVLHIYFYKHSKEFTFIFSSTLAHAQWFRSNSFLRRRGGGWPTCIIYIHLQIILIAYFSLPIEKGCVNVVKRLLKAIFVHEDSPLPYTIYVCKQHITIEYCWQVNDPPPSTSQTKFRFFCSSF